MKIDKVKEEQTPEEPVVFPYKEGDKVYFKFPPNEPERIGQIIQILESGEIYVKLDGSSHYVIVIYLPHITRYAV